eukprot:scaffold62153_cov61-Phaeocystis_antarctica.AAC.16
MMVSPFLSSTCNCVERRVWLGQRGAWLHAWVEGRLGKGGERACTTSAASAASVSDAAVAAAAADTDAGSVTSDGAAVVSRLSDGEGVSLVSSIHLGFRRCGFLSCNSTSCAYTSATLGARSSCTYGR